MAITVFSFPPDKGNVGTAAYLNVFGSIYKVLQDLKAQGYTVDDVPEQQEDLIKMVSRPDCLSSHREQAKRILVLSYKLQHKLCMPNCGWL